MRFTLFDDVYVTPCIFANNYVKENIIMVN